MAAAKKGKCLGRCGASSRNTRKLKHSVDIYGPDIKHLFLFGFDFTHRYQIYMECSLELVHILFS
jgi:hypothetical protein